MTGRIFDIQRFSLHDGPGIRTTVFLKGCSLRCLWCHNPESISPSFEVQCYPAKCIGCGRCLAVCPSGALSAGPQGVRFDRGLCTACGRCAGECCAGARVLSGREASVEDVMGTVLRDRAYYESSGGGVTASGGEPLLQHGFLRGLLQSCKDCGIHTAVETAGNVPWERFEAVAGLVDLFLFDVKHVDDAAHRAGCGAGAALTQANLERLLASGARVWVRIPVIPGFNASEAGMEQIALRLASLTGIEKVEFMPFHSLGAGKSDSLGRDYGMRSVAPPSREELERYARLFAAQGVTAVLPT